MVDEITKLGELLKLPDLEEETKALINAKMREMIGDIKPIPPEFKEQAMNILSLWTEGKKEGE
ncbi:hypothetical protein [Paenibacillus urinalis]|uniref:hypothetical protein n=1 Tax=Paenibacillus urinalis TaxID=521520 RepID=UPI00195F77BA